MGWWKSVVGYSLRNKRGKTTYVGVTNNPRRRAKQHRSAGKKGRMRVETRGMSRSRAHRWESRRLSKHRRRNYGRNPRYNKTRTGRGRYRW